MVSNSTQNILLLGAMIGIHAIALIYDGDFLKVLFGVDIAIIGAISGVKITRS